MKKCSVSFLFMLMSILVAHAQSQNSNNPFTDSLKQNLSRATTAEQKVKILDELAQFYMGVDRKQSDEYTRQQTQIAEDSRDRKLMIKALFTNSLRFYNMAGRQDNITTGISYAQKALDLAKTSHLSEYEAWAYLLLVKGARSNGENDKALNYNNLALSLASSSENDSLKINCFNSIGNTYLSKNEKMLAFRNYLQAINLAEISKRYQLLKMCYYTMANFYADLEEYERAKDYLYKILALTYTNKVPLERHDLFNRLGQIYSRDDKHDMAISFYEKSLTLADSLQMEVIKLNTYINMLDTYISRNEYQKALDFFRSKTELIAFMRQAGFDHFINQAYGMAYTSIGNLDSGIFYLRKAEPGFERNASIYNRYWFYNNMAFYHKKKNDYKTALTYYLKSKAIADQVGNVGLRKNNAGNLDSVYQKLGDYENAYLYNHIYHQAKDSLDKLSDAKDRTLLEVENENKLKEREALAEQEALRDRHNIQYMGITIAIAGVFIVLVMLGIFSVSETTIRILGFFAFIFLFEFLILLADHQIHHWTHGEPWKIMVIKIGLISILLPLHHYMEKKVINYLTSKKMFELNKEAILSKFSAKKVSG